MINNPNPYVIMTKLFDQPYFFEETSKSNGLWSPDLKDATRYNTRRLAEVVITVQELEGPGVSDATDIVVVSLSVAKNKVKNHKET